MDFTAELSKIYNVTPFYVMKQDKDEVIMLINYMAEKAETVPTKNAAAGSNENTQTYIKVNNKTATGGWW
jgi:hypothetical protein